MDVELTNRGEEGGFTVIEVLIALLILLVGMAGILSMQLTAIKATGFSRHATEATIVGEDEMESLRTVAFSSLANGTDQVDSRGVPSGTGLFTRTWTITTSGSNKIISVSVSWEEEGGEPYTITMATMRSS